MLFWTYKPSVVTIFKQNVSNKQTKRALRTLHFADNGRTIPAQCFPT